jgi:hypothetical protein
VLFIYMTNESQFTGISFKFTRLSVCYLRRVHDRSAPCDEIV